MENIVANLNLVLATGGILLICGAALLLFDLFSKNFVFKKLAASYGLLAAFCLSFASSAMTLVYSEIFGFIPCGLCWLQRVCLYPQVVILGLAVYTKDKTVAKYGIALSIFGVIISAYQHYLQMGGSELVTCPATGGGADCAERFLFEYGFVTFPLISVFLFIFLIALYLYIAKTK